jgi:hypothetical protein
MRNRTTKALLSLSLVAVFALPGIAQAKHGADDPVGHVRHASHAHHHARHHAHHHARHHAHHGADDGANHR